MSLEYVERNQHVHERRISYSVVKRLLSNIWDITGFVLRDLLDLFLDEKTASTVLKEKQKILEKTPKTHLGKAKFILKLLERRGELIGKLLENPVMKQVIEEYMSFKIGWRGDFDWVRAGIILSHGLPVYGTDEIYYMLDTRRQVTFNEGYIEKALTLLARKITKIDYNEKRLILYNKMFPIKDKKLIKAVVLFGDVNAVKNVIIEEAKRNHIILSDLYVDDKMDFRTIVMTVKGDFNEIGVLKKFIPPELVIEYIVNWNEFVIKGGEASKKIIISGHTDPENIFYNIRNSINTLSNQISRISRKIEEVIETVRKKGYNYKIEISNTRLHKSVTITAEKTDVIVRVEYDSFREEQWHIRIRYKVDRAYGGVGEYVAEKLSNLLREPVVVFASRKSLEVSYTPEKNKPVETYFETAEKILRTTRELVKEYSELLEEKKSGPREC